MMADAVFVIHRRVEQVVATGTRTATPYGGMSNPMTTAGDIIVGGSAGVPDRLAIGAAGKVLGVVAGSPAWVDPTGGGGGGGAVDSVNGQVGVVVLDAAAVGADVAGAATAAVAAHTALSDPHPQYLTPAEAASAYAPLAHVGSGGAAHANAIAAGTAGFMTGADKTKLDGVAAGATQNSADATLLARANHTGTQTASTISDFASASRAQTEAELVAGTNVTITPSGSGATRQLTIAAAGGGGSTNLSTTTSTTTLTVNSDTGTDAVLPAATPSVAGVLTAADKTKLDGVAAGATANANTDSLAEGPTNKYFTEIRVLATLMAGFTLIAGGAVSAADSLLVAVGKLQKQINDLFSGKQDTLVSGTTLKTVNGTSLLGAGDIALEKYRGLYVSLAALNAAVPTASAGDYADVDSGSGSNVKRYIWDTSDTAWVEQTGGGAGMSNPMTTAGDLIVGGAAGVPARLPVGAAGKVLGVSSGSPAWVDPHASGTSLPVVRTITSNETLGLSAVNSHTRSTAETNIDITIPPQASVAWADNTEMRFEQGAAGPITFLPGAGVTIEKKPGAVLKTPYRNCLLTLKRTATNVWSLLGELALVNTTCAVRSTEYAAVASGVTSIVVNKPAGTVDGDIMVMFVQGDGNGTLTSTGWTSRTSVGWVGGCFAILTKTASSEPASWTVTQTNSGVLNVRVVIVSGATAVDLNSTLPTPNSANPRTIASINPASDGLLLAGFFNTDGGATVTSSPPTMDIVGARITAGYSQVVVYSEKVPAGATGTRVLSWSSPSGSTEAMIVIR